MKELIFYLIVFVLVYLFYFIFVLKRKNVLKKFPDGKEMRYLKYRYGIKINEKLIKTNEKLRTALLNCIKIFSTYKRKSFKNFYLFA